MYVFGISELNGTIHLFLKSKTMSWWPSWTLHFPKILNLSCSWGLLSSLMCCFWGLQFQWGHGGHLKLQQFSEITLWVHYVSETARNMVQIAAWGVCNSTEMTIFDLILRMRSCTWIYSASVEWCEFFIEYLGWPTWMDYKCQPDFFMGLWALHFFQLVIFLNRGSWGVLPSLTTIFGICDSTQTWWLFL